MSSLSMYDLNACLIVDGEIACWGSDDAGELGNGVPGSVQVPAPAAVVGFGG